MKKILKNIGLFAFSFMLLILQPLKTYAAAPVPVIPEGFNPVVIQGGGGAVPVSPDIISTFLVALGIQIEDIVRTNVENAVGSPEISVNTLFSDPAAQEALWEAFNEADNTNHTLGDELSSWLKSQSLTKSSNQHYSSFEINRDLWDRANEATSDGIMISLPTTGTNISYEQFHNLYLIGYESYFEPYFSTPAVFTSAGDFYNIVLGCDPNIYYFNNIEYLRLADQSASDVWVYQAGQMGSIDSTTAFSRIYSSVTSGRLATINGVKYCQLGGDGLPINVWGSVGIAPTSNQKLGISGPFRNAKINNHYDVIGKSNSINPDTGKIEGPVKMSVLNPSQLQQLQDLINQGILTIGEALNKLNLFAYDQNSGILIDNGLDPNQAINTLAEPAPDPAPTEPYLDQSFQVIDGWDPVVPAPELPFTGGMSWLAAQMQTLMTISNFQNIWLVISTLAVAMLIIGMKRLWK